LGVSFRVKYTSFIKACQAKASPLWKLPDLQGGRKLADIAALVRVAAELLHEERDARRFALSG